MNAQYPQYPQYQSPAIEVRDWGHIMIGKNDTSINPSYNHLLTFGKGDPSNNAGLWCIHGSCYKGFLIARAFNMGITTNSSSQTGGQRTIFIDSNMHIGMDRYQTAISQNHTLDVGGKIRAEAYHIHYRTADISVT